MKKFKNTIIALFAIGIVTTLASCDFLNNDTYDEANLIGTWEIDDASATMKVLGVDLVSFMTTTLGVLEDEAQLKFDSLASDFLDTMNGSINFDADYKYSMNLTGLQADTGTWALSEEGNDLYLYQSGKELIYEIQSLDATDMILDMPTESIELDLNNDSIPETNVNLIVVLELSKLLEE